MEQQRPCQSRVELVMSDEEARLRALVHSEPDLQPLLSFGEARAIVGLLRILSLGDGDGSDLAYELAGELDRRLPAK